MTLTRRLFLALTGGVVASLRPTGATGKEEDPNTLSAADILRRMSETYLNCKTYQDTGKVVTVFDRGENERVAIRPFSTAFVRPDRFRFEFHRKTARSTDEWHRYIVWALGKEVRSWWDLGERLDRRASLGLGLAGATGVSGGSAHTVPSFLLPDLVSGRRFSDVVNLERLADGVFEGISCFRLTGEVVRTIENAVEDERRRRQFQQVTGRSWEDAVSKPLVLWIDRATFLLRRIDEQTQFASFGTTSTTTYEPLIDAPIAEGQLAFGAPEKESV